METVIPQPALQQDCLDKLSRILDLVLKTAEAASAENNHKLVIQSAREASRIVALLHKMTNSRTKPAPSLQGGLAGGKTAGPCAPKKKTTSGPYRSAKNHPDAGRDGETSRNLKDLIRPDRETLLTPADLDYWESSPDDAFKKFIESDPELQTLGKEVADFLRESNQESGAAD